MDWATVGEISGIFFGIVAGLWGGGLALSKVMKDKFTANGQHEQIHQRITEDVDAAHEMIRNHDDRINELEKTTSAIAGKLDEALKNQRTMIEVLMGMKK